MSGAETIDIDIIFPEGDELARQVTSLWEQWKHGRADWRDRVEEVRKYLYATSTRETANVQNDHEHTTHTPKLTQIRDNLEANYMAAMFPSDDWLRFDGQDADAELFEKKRSILGYINTKHKLNNFYNIVNELVRDWIDTGNCFAGVTYVRKFHTDAETGELVYGYIGPEVYRISPDDIVFNPFASDFLSTPKIIRSIKTMGELHRDAEENPELGYSMDIIDKVKKSRDMLMEFSDTTIDKHLQFSFDGFGSPSQYYRSGYVEILELYGDIYDTYHDEWMKNRVVTVVDRTWIVRNEPLNTWTGKPHIYHCGWRIRPENLWGMGPLDNLVGMQYYINHLENARADAFDQMIDPDRRIYGDVEVEMRGAAVDYYIVEGGDVSYLAPDTTVLNADFAIQRKEAQMEEYAGAPREAMGIRTPGEKTAFEVAELQNAASRIFQSKVTAFETVFLERIVNAEIEVARQNLDTADVIKVVDDDFAVTEFLEVTVDDLKSNGKLIPVGGRHFARQAQLAQNLIQFTSAMQQDQLLAQHFPSERLAKAWEDLLGFKRLELFERFGRVEEELEMARMQSAAQDQLQVEQSIFPEDELPEGGEAPATAEGPFPTEVPAEEEVT